MINYSKNIVNLHRKIDLLPIFLTTKDFLCKSDEWPIWNLLSNSRYLGGLHNVCYFKILTLTIFIMTGKLINLHFLNFKPNHLQGKVPFTREHLQGEAQNSKIMMVGPLFPIFRFLTKSQTLKGYTKTCQGWKLVKGSFGKLATVRGLPLLIWLNHLKPIDAVIE